MFISKVPPHKALNILYSLDILNDEKKSFFVTMIFIISQKD